MKDHNYYELNLAQGNKVTFKLDALRVPCPVGQTSIIKTMQSNTQQEMV